jgi:putative serine protease PepD
VVDFMQPMNRSTRFVALIGLVALVIGLLGLGSTLRRSSASVVTKTVVCSNSPAPGGTGESASAGAVQASSSVVSVTARTSGATESGSGIVLRSDGLVMTNNHVVADAAVNGGTVTVATADGQTSKATVLGRNAGSDVAVILASGLDGLRPAELGSATSLHVGDPVLVVGNALQLPGTVTAGIVSGLDRDVTIDVDPPSDSEQDLFGTQPYLPAELKLTGMIQTDATMNEGDSGGALVNAAGDVVGMCTAIKTTAGSSGSIGVGFAMPIDVAYAVAQRLLAEPAPVQR